MKEHKLVVACHEKRYKLHLSDIRKVSKLIKITTPKLPKYSEDEPIFKPLKHEFEDTLASCSEFIQEDEIVSVDETGKISMLGE